MIESRNNVENQDKKTNNHRTPEARYAYYRRCQVFKENGQQCKAPACKGEHICYAHEGQRTLALRRERERRAVLEEVVRRMRRRGTPEFQMADIFLDFNAIQVTLAVMAQALIDGCIDCKTAGRLAVGLQMSAKLLDLYHRARSKDRDERKVEQRELPRSHANECGVLLRIDVYAVKAGVETNISSGRSILAA